MRNTKSPLIRISGKLLKEWNKRQLYGDVKKLTDYTGFSKPVIIRALKKGEARAEVILKISRFFAQRDHYPDDISKQALEMLK
ncbi:MAG: hypothetical protein KIT80_18035 [Chitinophagaceae bacterium]|nr:hypothetical protein [Chitinophagaceae bacterium]MCW5928826.1 hypothetical protein [Chitinophagaceae bacterium]